LNENKEYLRCSGNWLLLAQKNKKGYSLGFSLIKGWKKQYPETTGYIIETMFDLSEFFDDEKYKLSAINAGNWLLEIQNKDGSFYEPDNKKPMVFDTGQAFFGLIKIFKETRNKLFLKAAIKAADWICEQQEKDGSWKKNTFYNIPHTYYSRVSLALLKLWKITKNRKYKNSAVKQLNWAVGQQLENGWFKNCSFFNDNKPVLHTIAYTIEGLLESGIILNEKKYILAAKKSIDALVKSFYKKNILYSFYDKNWQPIDKEICLTGIAQISIILIRLSRLADNQEYLNIAVKLNNYLKQKIKLKSILKSTRGVLAGSVPIWGKYMPFMYPNWAVKFFIDSLILEEKNNK